MDSLIELINVQAQNIFFSFISKTNDYCLSLKKLSFKSAVNMKSEFYDGKQNNCLVFFCHQLCSEFTIQIFNNGYIFSLFNLDGVRAFLSKQHLTQHLCADIKAPIIPIELKALL